MDITKRLQELNADFILHNEGDWQNPLDRNKAGYTSFNDAGICTEDGEFLYAMVRILKPDAVLETGTHWGVGASYMGMALKDNKKGKLETIEFLEPHWQRAQKNITALGLDEYVVLHLQDAAKFVPSYPLYKLILLDTEPQTRFAEAIKFFDYLELGGFMFIHDLHQHMHQVENSEHGFAWPFGKVPAELSNLVAYKKLVPFHFETPRGLTGFYKLHPNDYKWS